MKQLSCFYFCPMTLYRDLFQAVSYCASIFIFFFFGKCTYIIFIFHYVICCTMYVYEAIKSRRTHIIVYLFDVKPRSGVKNCQNKLQPKLYLVYMYINRENGNHHYRHNFCQTITDKNDFFARKIRP